MFAFNTTHQTFREITSAIGPDNIAIDENANLIVYESSDRKVYSFGTSEAVACAYETKTIPLTDDVNGVVVRYIAITYTSATKITTKVWLDNQIESGDIATGVVYYVFETPYVNGTTYTITYPVGSAFDYTHGQTFTGLVGKSTFTIKAGTGIVELYKSDTSLPYEPAVLPITTGVKTVKIGIRERATKVRVRIEDTATSTTATEIHRLSIYTE